MLILQDHITYGFVLERTQSQRTLCEYKRLLTHDAPVVFSGNISSRAQRHIHKYEDSNGIFSPFILRHYCQLCLGSLLAKLHMLVTLNSGFH